jgi:hypothetical protein
MLPFVGRVGDGVHLHPDLWALDTAAYWYVVRLTILKPTENQPT